MSLWIILVAIAVFCDGTSTFVDNYITDVYFKGRHAMAQKLFFGFAYILIAIGFLIFSGMDFGTLALGSVGILLLAGIVNGLSDIPYYSAIEIEDATEVGIFFQLSPVIYLIAGWLFLNETISPVQFVAFLIILSAPILIILSTRKRSRKIKFKAAAYVMLYILIDVVSNIVFLTTDAESLDVYQEIAFLILGKGIANTLVVWCWPKMRKRFKTVMKNSKGKVLRPLTIDLILNLSYDFVYRLALATAPVVALASVACDATEPIAIFFLGIIFTLIAPKFGREKMKKKVILVHLVATLLVVAGIIILQ